MGEVLLGAIVDVAQAAAGRPAVSVIVPAYNEEGAITAGVAAIADVLRGVAIPFEIIVVNDGSSDRTGEIARTLDCRLIDMPHNGGYGRALKAGIAVSKADLVAIIDADGTYPASALPEMIAMAAYNDMVVGDRGAAMKGVPLIRRPAKWMLNTLATVLAQHKVTDLNSGLRVFRRTRLTPFMHLLPDAFSFTTTITLCMLAAKLHVAYLPIRYEKRIGNSKIKPRDFFKFMFLVCRLTAYFQPLRIFMPLGGFLFLIGLLKGLYDIYIGKLSETAVLGLLGACMICSLGLIADMIARLEQGRNPVGSEG